MHVHGLGYGAAIRHISRWVQQLHDCEGLSQVCAAAAVSCASPCPRISPLFSPPTAHASVFSFAASLPVPRTAYVKTLPPSSAHLFVRCPRLPPKHHPLALMFHPFIGHLLGAGTAHVVGVPTLPCHHLIRVRQMDGGYPMNHRTKPIHPSHHVFQ